MSGSGAGAAVRIRISLECRGGSGRPERWLVTITGESFFSRVASATNSSATSIKPATERKMSAGIAAGFRLMKI
jgi:hypothetical protein